MMLFHFRSGRSCPARLRAAIILFFLLTLSSSLAGGQEETAPPENSPETLSRAAQFQKIADEASGQYTFTLNDSQSTKLILVKNSLLRWTNPVGGNWDGHVYLWTAGGRPAVIASIYKAYHRDGQPMTHEFQALTTETLTAVRRGETVWKTKAAAISWKRISEAAAPLEFGNLRRSQMRTLARKFSVIKTDREGTSRNLRLLSQPVFRYQAKKEGLLDGALFVFAQTTDPEVLLLIEARHSASGPQWVYALAKMNSVEMRVSYNDREVWSAPMVPWSDTRDRDAAYTVFYRQ